MRRLIGLIISLISIMLFAQNAGSTINNVLHIPKLAIQPIIDGELDEELDTPNLPDVGMFVYVDDQVPSDGAADLSGFYIAGWVDGDTPGFYFYGRVIDDSVDTQHQNPWERDSWEIYFDGGNEKAASYDGNDVQWRYVYGEETGNPGPGEFVTTLTSNGWAIELWIPADSLQKNGTPLFSLQEGTIIGWEAQVNDNDGADRENILKWWSNSNDSWQNPSLFGTAKLANDDVKLQIPYIELPPASIDGFDDDWEGVPAITMSVGGERSYPDGGRFDLSSYYRIAWNADGIYFYGKVVDDSIDTQHQNPWERDSWEIYFDGGNEKAASYDGNDVQWRYVYNEETGNPGPGSVSGGTIAWTSTSDGWALELVIPVDSLKKDGNPLFPLQEGQIIGWEAQINENDGGNRQNMLKWWSYSNDSWQNPSLFGTAVLSVLGVAEAPLAVKLSAPALVNSNAKISYTILARSSVNLKLYNLVGQEVKTLVKGVKDAGTQEAELDVSDLANGVYLLKLTAGSSEVAKKITVLK
ncbi:MAG: sugar-binding protein [candidate division WOR-3 bacterium]